MATWKRLTLTDPLTRKVDVNIEAVAYMRRDAGRDDDFTTIVSMAAKADSLFLNVKETPVRKPPFPKRIARTQSESATGLLPSFTGKRAMRQAHSNWKRPCDVIVRWNRTKFIFEALVQD